jgi:hypothetical protein
MDRPFSLVGNSSIVLEVWEASDRLPLPQVQKVGLWKHGSKHARQRPPLEPYLSLARQPVSIQCKDCASVVSHAVCNLSKTALARRYLAMMSSALAVQTKDFGLLL